MTHRPCLSAEEIANCIRGAGTDDSLRHVDECEACARRVSFVRRIRAAGLRPIADVTGEVDGLVANLLAAPRKTWWKIVQEPEYRRAEVARRLLSLGVNARLRDRQLAVDLAKAATTIVDRLVRSVHDVADLRFEAWKFASAVFREAGRYTDTESAFVSAEEAARVASDPEVAQASVLLSRALFCAEPDVWKPEEATALLDRAECVFARRDAARMQAALTTRALLLFRSGDTEAAREIFRIVLAETPKTDRESYLNALSNLMSAKVELREKDVDVEEAIAFLIEENTALGRTVQVARARWMMGRVQVVRGEYSAAVDLLKAAMVDIGDSDSSIRIGMDTIEALLLAERHEEVFILLRELASAAVAIDEREPSRRRYAYSRNPRVSSRNGTA